MRLKYRGITVDSRQIVPYRVWLERDFVDVADLFGRCSCRVRNKNHQSSLVVRLREMHLVVYPWPVVTVMTSQNHDRVAWAKGFS